MSAFWWLGTTFGVILFAYFTFSSFSEKIEKSMQKMFSKIRVFWCKTGTSGPQDRLILLFWLFLGDIEKS